jgi:hypothetical protein
MSGRTLWGTYFPTESLFDDTRRFPEIARDFVGNGHFYGDRKTPPAFRVCAARNSDAYLTGVKTLRFHPNDGLLCCDAYGMGKGHAQSGMNCSGLCTTARNKSAGSTSHPITRRTHAIRCAWRSFAR